MRDKKKKLMERWGIKSLTVKLPFLEAVFGPDKNKSQIKPERPRVHGDRKTKSDKEENKNSNSEASISVAAKEMGAKEDSTISAIFYRRIGPSILGTVLLCIEHQRIRTYAF